LSDFRHSIAAVNRRPPAVDAEIAVTASFGRRRTVEEQPDGMGDFTSMLWWLPRRRARIISIDAEAEALISELGFDAYDEALRREIEASSDALARDCDRVAQAIAQKTGASPDAPPETDFVADRESAAEQGTRLSLEPSPLDRLNTAISTKPLQFRVQFICAGKGREPSMLMGAELQAEDLSAAVVAAASLTFPPMTNGLRIIDREGRVVFARQKASLASN
jgi:hypothetical protein